MEVDDALEIVEHTEIRGSSDGGKRWLPSVPA
jgi:hypothetical protein